MASTSTPDMTQYVGDHNTDGTSICSVSSDKLGIWGATKIARTSLSTIPIASIPATTALTTGDSANSTTFWGFTGSAQANNLISMVRALCYNALNTGLAASA